MNNIYEGCVVVVIGVGCGIGWEVVVWLVVCGV